MPVLKVKYMVSSYMARMTGYGKYQDETAYDDVINYCFDSKKLTGYGGRGVHVFQAAMEFRKLSKAYGKDHGIRIRHWIVSFSEKEANCFGYDTDKYLKNFAEYAVNYYGNSYQIIYAVHGRSRNPHVHFVMNTVNYHSGEKYGGDKDDYYSYQRYLRNFLRTYWGMELTVASDGND